MRKLLFFLMLLYLAIPCPAQIYKYIGVEDGLSNRRVYAIKKDAEGYMWFLTHDGIDRYDGYKFKRYKLKDGEEEISSMMNLNWLYTDTEGKVWVIGRKGRVFCYDLYQDRFKLVYKLPDEGNSRQGAPVSYGFIDQSNTVWLCTRQQIFLYDSQTKTSRIFSNPTGKEIHAIAQQDSVQYYIGTENGLYCLRKTTSGLTNPQQQQAVAPSLQITSLYLHPTSEKVFIGTSQQGVFVYSPKEQQIAAAGSHELTDISINRICPFSNKELLIATDGAGIYKMDMDNNRTQAYIVADYNSNNGMNGNTINDLYIDEQQRIWIANYPIGITVCNNNYPEYTWIKHSIGNRQSLVNDQINAIIEDHEGDLWFATNNGVSMYERRSDTWHSFLSEFNQGKHSGNHTFISLCEASPGIIWVGGYNDGIHRIDKLHKTVSFIPYSLPDIRPEMYTRALTRDSSGHIWAGGYHNLQELDKDGNCLRHIPGLSGISNIVEKDREHLWIGGANGLFLLEKSTGHYRRISLPAESDFLYSLYQAADGKLYIGINNTGLLVYDTDKNAFRHYKKDNSALLTNNIYTILPDKNGKLILSSESGLCRFDPQTETFHNWTKEQGLRSDHFNAGSGTLCQNGDLIFGSTDGAIEFDSDMHFPDPGRFKIVLSDLRVLYRTVYPGEKHSPLTLPIDQTEQLRLHYNQNIFSIHVSSINYDAPSLILYSWMLEGFYDVWSQPEHDCTIHFTNLSPGTYTLRVKAVCGENPNLVLEERSMQIVIGRPLWLSMPALIIYILLVIGASMAALRIAALRRQRKLSNEKIQFFINTAHDIRTPLTLIKAPLEELAENEQLSPGGKSNMDTALHNVNILLRQTSNLLNFERAANYSHKLHIGPHRLETFLTELIDSFRPGMEAKHIALHFEHGFETDTEAWFDKEKIESVLKNLLSNALKYTPEGGRIEVIAQQEGAYWSVDIKDNGIGIPASEQKKLFRMYFRGSNAINYKITGSGIGLLLVKKLTQLHKGKLSFSSTEGQGTDIKVSFPLAASAYRKSDMAQQAGKPQEDITLQDILRPTGNHGQKTDSKQENTVSADAASSERSKLLVVEDNDELRNYLQRSLGNEFDVRVCTNGKEALSLVKADNPDLIISDVMMPEMRGDELCRILKNDINTSHIPIILLTALNSDKHIIEGLQSGADEYVVKPFSNGVLRATIANLLKNREILRRKYASLELSTQQTDNPECSNCTSDLDWKFMATVKQEVEKHMDDTTFNVDVLCGLLNMSRTSFYNKIKALTAQAPADYIRLIRLKHATRLLSEQKYSISEIADMTGFSDAKYFREVFKKHFNVSPSQYAKENKTNNNNDNKPSVEQ